MSSLSPKLILTVALLLVVSGLSAADDPFAPDAGDKPDVGGAKPGAPPAAKPTEKTKPGADKPDLEAGLPEGPERNPVVLAIRDSKPSKPDELMFAVQTLVDIGRVDEAKVYLKKLVATAPQRDTLVSFHDKYGSAFFYRLLRDHRLKPEGEPFARSVLDAAYAAARDPALLQTLVKQLNDPAPLARDQALDKLRAADTAVLPPIFAALSDRNRAAEQPRLRAALVALGPGLIDPLLAVLDSADATLRVQVMDVLGQFRTPRAIPLLIGPSLAADTPAEVREAAKQTLLQIVGKQPSRYEAEQFLYRRAKGFFDGDLPAKPDDDDQITMWQWDEQQKTCVARHYPAAQAGLMLAARLARDLYRMAPENVDFRRLFLTTNLQFAQLERGLDRPLPQGQGTTYAEAAALGTGVVEDLLVYALEKGYAPAAQAAVQILGERGQASLLRADGGRPRALALALQSADRRVRLAAARAIMHIDPQAPYAGSSALPETLAYLIRSVGARRVLVAHPRTERAQSLVGFLNQIGFAADSARTGNEVFQRASTDPDYEFVMLSDGIDKPSASETIQMLRRDPRTSGLPVGLMAREETLEKAELSAEHDRLVLAFPRPHDTQTMGYEATRLAQLSGRATTTRDERVAQAQEALDYLVRMAQAPREYGFYDLLRHEAAIQAALALPQLSGQAATVLGWLGSPSAQRALVTFAGQTARPVAARQAAAKAFAFAVQRHGVLLTREEVLQQYERYNQSATEDEETQQLLASLLDAIESRSKKPQPGAAPAAAEQPAPPGADAADGAPPAKPPLAAGEPEPSTKDP